MEKALLVLLWPVKSKNGKAFAEKAYGHKDVAYAFSFPLHSNERKVLLEQLRNRGNFKHNAKVLEKGRGEVVTMEAALL